MSKRDVIRKLAGIPPDMICEHSGKCDVDGSLYFSGVEGGRCPHALVHKKGSACSDPCPTFGECYCCKEVK